MSDDSSLKFHANLNDLERILRYVESQVQAFQVRPSDLHDILLITTEAVTNILLHGYQGKKGFLEIKVKESGGSVIIVLRDKAPDFNPMQVTTPDLTLPLDKRSLGGMGVHLMRQFSDQIMYRALPKGGNEITLIKHGVFQETSREEVDGDNH